MIEIYDTTLRDGTQREGISLSCDDKLRIAQRLDELGVAFIEGGWPGSNPKDAEFFERARDDRVAARADHRLRRHLPRRRQPRGRRQHRGAARGAARRSCTVVGKTWTLHVTEVLRTTLDENLRIIAESLAYLRAQGRRVIYDAEHFFDGYRADPAYALETLRAAVRGGAETLVLCDTNGGSLPWQIERDRARRAQGRSATASASTATTTRESRRGQLAGRRAGRRRPGAGHDQRLRRALRQRQPVLRHPRPRAEDGLALPARRAASRR